MTFFSCRSLTTRAWAQMKRKGAPCVYNCPFSRYLFFSSICSHTAACARTHTCVKTSFSHIWWIVMMSSWQREGCLCSKRKRKLMRTSQDIFKEINAFPPQKLTKKSLSPQKSKQVVKRKTERYPVDLQRHRTQTKSSFTCLWLIFPYLNKSNTEHLH